MENKRFQKWHLIRIYTIRETSFVSSGYAIAEAIAFILAIGLIFVKIDTKIISK